MLDKYGRNIEYMRISVTDRCNLRCKYCMPQGVPFVPMTEILTYEEIVRVVRLSANLGIKHFRLTGGESLVRRGITTLAGMISDVSGVESVSLTTNAILLSQNAKSLKAAGITGVNVSLDTINPYEYEKITGCDGINAVLDGIDSALSVGLNVKLNAVDGMCGDIEGLVAYAQEKKIIIRFIEMMPIGYGKDYANPDNINRNEGAFARLEGLYGQAIPLGGNNSTNSYGNGPARYYHYKALPMPIGFIQAMSRRFCDGCNRIRLTSQGWLKPCLCFDTGLDLRSLIRNGASDDIIKERMFRAIFDKPTGHCFQNQEAITEQNYMVKIGG
jgi:cyclic pyranopterin phosphate synthase